MPDQIQNDEAPTRAADVFDHRGEFLVAQMMRHAHTYGDIGAREFIANGVTLQNRETLCLIFGRL